MKKVFSFILAAMLFLGCIQTYTYAAEVNPTPTDAVTQEAGAIGIDPAFLGLPCNHLAWLDGESMNIKYYHVYSNGYHETSRCYVEVTYQVLCSNCKYVKETRYATEYRCN